MGAHNASNNQKSGANQDKLNSNISKVDFHFLKNKNILKQIFGNLKLNKYLKIVKYNKTIQQHLDLSINDYKDYSNSLSVELMIIPNKKVLGKFINISEGQESYFHIYFNDSKEEIERISLNKDDNVSNIKIIIDYQITSFEKLFYCCSCIESIYLF